MFFGNDELPLQLVVLPYALRQLDGWGRNRKKKKTQKERTVQMKAVSPNYSVHPVMQQDGYRIIHESDIAVGQRVFLVNEPTRQNVDQIHTATIVFLQYSGICRWRKLSSVVLEFKDFGKLEIGVADLINPQTTPTGGPRQAFYVKS